MVDMDAAVAEFRAFDERQCERRGIPPAGRGGIRETYYRQGFADGGTAVIRDKGDGVKDAPDVIFTVYRGRPIRFETMTERAEKVMSPEGASATVDEFGHKILRGKSEKILGAAIMRAVMLDLRVAVRQGTEWGQ